MPPARILFWAATLGGIIVAVRAALKEPPPLEIALAIALGYALIILSGVFFLRLRMFADAIIRGPEEARGVVLTFDDGPDPVHTPRVLDVLDAHDAKATFFVIGKKAEAHPEVVKQIVERGHDVGVHGYAHDRLFSLRGPRRVERDLKRAVVVVEKITGKRPTLFRPPIGHTNPTIARVAERLDLTVVGWSVAGYDGIARAKAKDVVTRVRRGLENGAIVLLHDAAERSDHEPVGPKALPDILDAIEAKDLRIEKLRDWVAISG
jgi:peptidoglycan-N-acetylglucosamine deacetylase